MIEVQDLRVANWKPLGGLEPLEGFIAEKDPPPRPVSITTAFHRHAERHEAGQHRTLAFNKDTGECSWWNDEARVRMVPVEIVAGVPEDELTFADLDVDDLCTVCDLPPRLLRKVGPDNYFDLFGNETGEVDKGAAVRRVTNAKLAILDD